MKFLRTILVVSALLAGCSRTEKQTTNANPAESPSPKTAQIAMVRLIQAVPGDQRVDLWFGDAKAISNAGYTDITSYVEVPAERRDFRMQSSGDTAPSVTDSESLSAGEHYTVVVEPKDDKNKITVLHDDLAPPKSGKAKLRVVNATYGKEKLALVDPSGEIFSGIDSDSSTSYKEVTAGNQEMEIRRGAKKADVLRIRNFNMEPGKIYTIVIVGGGTQTLQAIPVVDQQNTVPTGD